MFRSSRPPILKSAQLNSLANANQGVASQPFRDEYGPSDHPSPGEC